MLLLCFIIFFILFYSRSISPQMLECNHDLQVVQFEELLRLNAAVAAATVLGRSDIIHDVRLDFKNRQGDKKTAVFYRHKSDADVERRHSAGAASRSTVAGVGSESEAGLVSNVKAQNKTTNMAHQQQQVFELVRDAEAKRENHFKEMSTKSKVILITNTITSATATSTNRITVTIIIIIIIIIMIIIIIIIVVVVVIIIIIIIIIITTNIDSWI